MDLDFIETIAINMKALNKTALNSIDYALNLFKGSKSDIINVFRKTFQLLNLNYLPQEAFLISMQNSKIKSKEIREILISAIKRKELNDIIIEIYIEIKKFNEDKLIKKYGKIQNQFLLVVLLSSILPSLLLFVFAGYSMLYNSTLLTIVFITSFTFILPFSLAILLNKIGELND
ncbi:MAG: hypothetical protein QXD11_01185 [Candidatus Micrarchaeaceae archaeon]